MYLNVVIHLASAFGPFLAFTIALIKSAISRSVSENQGAHYLDLSINQAIDWLGH